MDSLSALQDNVKREICNRCEFFSSPTLNGKLCARTGEAIVSLIAKQFSERPDVQKSQSGEVVTVDLGCTVTVESTKDEVLEGLTAAEAQLASVASDCTSARGLHSCRVS